MELHIHLSRTWLDKEKSEPPTGFEPMTSQLIPVGLSHHSGSYVTYILHTGRISNIKRIMYLFQTIKRKMMTF